MQIKVLFFASCREITRTRELVVELPGGVTVGDFRQELGIRYPDLKNLEKILSVAVNAEYADDATVLGPGDEVAVIPPVSGGGA